MREYELMFLVRPDIEDERIPSAIQKVQQFVTSLGGEVKDVSQGPPWGRRRLAYPIGNFQEAYYAVMRLNLEPQKTSDLERDLKLSEEIVRYLLTIPS